MYFTATQIQQPTVTFQLALFKTIIIAVKYESENYLLTLIL